MKHRKTMLHFTILVCITFSAFSQEPSQTQIIFPVAKNGKVGFIDKTGRQVIPCEYSFYKAGSWAIGDGRFRDASDIAIDQPLRSEDNRDGLFYVYLPKFNDNNEGIIPIVKDKKIGFLREDGVILFKPQFYGIIGFKNNRAWVKNKNGKFSYIDTEGHVFIDNVEEIGFDSLRVDDRRYYCPETGYCPFKKDGLWGFIDKSGKIVVHNQFDKVNCFSKSMALVVLQGKKQMIDPKGKIYDYDYPAVPISYGIEDPEEQLLLNNQTGGNGIFHSRKGWLTQQKYSYVGPLREGLRGFSLPNAPNMFGYMDEKENVVIPPQFNYAYPFKNGLALIGVGEILTDYDFCNGTPISGLWGYVNKKGEIIWVPSWGPIGEDYYGNVEEVNDKKDSN